MTETYEISSWGTSFDAAEAVLAAILTDAKAIQLVRPLLATEDFPDTEHQYIYDAALVLADHGMAIDATTLADALGGDLTDAGGKAYLDELLKVTPPRQVVRTAETLRALADRRRLHAEMKADADAFLRLEMGAATSDELRQRWRDTFAKSDRLLRKERTVAVSKTTGLRHAIRALDAPPWIPPEFLVDDLFVAGELALVAGDGGTFKSTMALHTAGAVAGGYPAFDRFATQRGSVLIVSAEDSLDVVMMRLEAIIVGHGWDRTRVLADIHVFALVDVSLANETWQKHLREEAQRVGARFILFDPWFEVSGGEENSSTENRPAIQFLRRLAADQNAATMIVHHVNKPASDKRHLDRIRGTTALPSAMRSILFVDEAPAGSRVTHVKMSRAPKVDPFVVSRTIAIDPAKRTSWTFARFAIADSLTAAVTPARAELLPAEVFILAQLDGKTPSDRMTTTALKALAIGSGNSGKQISEALVRLEFHGRIESQSGPNNAKYWYATPACPASSKIADQMSLPSLPGACPASSPTTDELLACPVRAGKLESDQYPSGQGEIPASSSGVLL